MYCRYIFKIFFTGEASVWSKSLKTPKEISHGISLEGMMLKLKLQYFGHLMRSWLIGKDSCWEGLGAGGEEDDRGWDGWMASLTRWTWVWVNSRSWWWTGRPGVLRFMGSQRVGHNWANDLIWSDLTLLVYPIYFQYQIYFSLLESKSYNTHILFEFWNIQVYLSWRLSLLYTNHFETLNCFCYPFL